MKEQKKYHVKICTGTLCHVMGGADLPDLESYLPENLKGKVKITGMMCAQFCKDENKTPPFVLLNDELIQGATIPKIIESIERIHCNDIHQ
jgi:NADH:ubiquinone oxidoreductase subunit E